MGDVGGELSSEDNSVKALQSESLSAMIREGGLK